MGETSMKATEKHEPPLKIRKEPSHGKELPVAKATGGGHMLEYSTNGTRPQDTVNLV
jgi:hypothetical protein